jgi:signal transduction histidine kinase
MQDRDGTVLYANLPAARLAGFATADEMMRAPLSDFPRRFEIFDEHGAPVPYARLPGRVALETGAGASLLLQVRARATGATWWTEIRSEPVRDEGGVAGVVNIWRDVTEQRRREASLQFIADAGAVLGGSLDYEKTLAELARVIVPALADWCSVDIVGDGGQVRSLAVAHADPAKVALARSVNDRWPPDPAQSGVHRVIRTGQPELHPDISDEALARSARDRDHLHVLRMLGLRSAMVIPLAARGQVFGAITLIAAESGRRYDERDLAFALDLGRRAAVAVDNARLYREAREAIGVRDDFLSIAGHELRTPLTAMLLQVHGLGLLAERGELARDPARFAQRLGKIAEQGARLEHLVDDLLDVSRIAAGRLALERRPVDLHDVVTQVVERFADDASAASSPIELRSDGVDGADRALVGAWDPHRLDQVVTNLISNAVKYGRGAPIEIEVSRQDGAARLVVRDRGIGVAPDDQARIFGRFERAVSDRNYGGLGLGLWITAQIVEAHGGRIAVQSAPGEGAEFTVLLPLDPPT